ncbi:FGGY-family carbohydrate kinase [Nonomuraea sp. SYSU D8015]|uniref:FGGY-family carbohydrate kinase n=1 Tax=Nonomuraea sp. SYSU D8015 TaxID=2593644 RepID=UPI001CB75627|nr:FGGY-family carbohydrate kinase [Nonomuraea sp. SYSU D8015]
MKATYGTGSSVMAVGGAAAAPGLCRSIAWDLGDGPVVGVEGNIRETGRTISWLSELFGVRTDVLLAEAEDAEPDGVHFVPAFGGLGAPRWEPDAAPVVTGLSPGTGRAQLVADAPSPAPASTTCRPSARPTPPGSRPGCGRSRGLEARPRPADVFEPAGRSPGPRGAQGRLARGRAQVPILTPQPGQ